MRLKVDNEHDYSLLFTRDLNKKIQLKSYDNRLFLIGKTLNLVVISSNCFLPL